MTNVAEIEDAIHAYHQSLRDKFKYFLIRSFYHLHPGQEFVDNWHLDAICEYMMACRDGDIKRLIINMPPRMMKSLASSVAFPAWILGNDPATKIICASYTQKLSNIHSLNCRSVMESGWYKDVFPECRFVKDQNQKGEYQTTRFGRRYSTSVGGTTTGYGGRYVIIDDPLDPGGAYSDAERQTANDWISGTIPSRLDSQEKGVIMVIMQRLHENDVTGHLLEQGGWEHLCLPVKNDRKKIIQINGFKKEFKDNELLNEERLPQKTLDLLEKEMGSREFSSQYLQNPIPPSGGILPAHHWKEWDQKSMPSCSYILQVYDTAFKDGKENDYTARTTWGIFTYNSNKPNIILLEAMNKRLTLPDLKREAIESYDDYDPDLVLIEDKASGISLIQELKRTGMRIRAVGRGKGDDKISRAHIASVVLEQGLVWYPKGKSWANEVIRQCASFPNAKYDDLTDTVTDALIFLRHYRRVEINEDDAAGEGSTSFKPKYGGHYG